MKTTKGDYEGASLAATFDLEISQMSKDQMAGLLECILHQAWPGEEYSAIVYRALAVAEENAGMNNPYPRK